jgi:hypothetical protein
MYTSMTFNASVFVVFLSRFSLFLVGVLTAFFECLLLICGIVVHLVEGFRVSQIINSMSVDALLEDTDLSALAIGTELANVPFDQMIRNLLLAMVAAQNDANTSFIEGVQDLVETPVNLTYTKAGDSSSTKTTISGNALAFGILPTLLQIQSGTIQIRWLSRCRNQRKRKLR